MTGDSRDRTGLEGAAASAPALRATDGLMARGKCKQQTITAVGRELPGFIWAIGVHVEWELNVAVRQAA